MGDEDPPGYGVAGVEVGGRPQDRFGVAQDSAKRLELLLRHMAGTRGGADLPGATDLQFGRDQREIGVAGPLPAPVVEPSSVVQSEFGQSGGAPAAPVPVPGGARLRHQFRRRLPAPRPGREQRGPQSGVRSVHLHRAVRRHVLAGGPEMTQHPRHREYTGQIAHNPFLPQRLPGRP